MKRLVTPLLCLLALTVGCGGASAGEAASVPTEETSTASTPDDGTAVAELGAQSALDAVGGAVARNANRWGWVEDPSATVTFPQGLQVLRSGTQNFDRMSPQRVAEELDVACGRLDRSSVEDVAGGGGWYDYGTDYWSLVLVASRVACTEHEVEVNAWVDRQAG